MKKNILSLITLALLTLTGAADAQIAPTISVQGTNATLAWASTPGETYTVLYRRAFHQAFPWITIATNLPASDDSETVFVHIGGVPRVPAEAGGGGGGGGGTPGTPSAAVIADPSGDPEKEKKDKQKDGGFPAFPELPDEKALEKWFKDMLKEYERLQREGGTGQPVLALMSSSLTAEQATNNSMGFYIVLDISGDVNGDGVVDGWAIHYGFDPFEDQNLVDSDGDGATNAEEFNAGSHPLNPIGLPGVGTSFLSERSATTNSLDGGMFYDEFRFEWGVGAGATNRYVFVAPFNGVVGDTTETVWPWQVAQLKPGTQTTRQDLQGGGVSNVVVTTNIALPTGPYQSTWRNGVIDGITNISHVHFIASGTNSNLKRVYEVMFSGSTGTNSFEMQPITNFAGLTIAGQNLNTNGACWVVIADNSRTNVTPVLPANATNVAYNITIAPVVLQLSFRNTDQLTQREVNGVGYGHPEFDGVTNLVGTTTLGTSNPPKNGVWFNFAEISAVVPTDPTFNTGFKWHRDVQDKLFIWHPIFGPNVGVMDATNFISKPTGVPPSNDDADGPADTIPDLTRRILTVDAPGPQPIDGLPLQQVPAGSASAHRFYAREWLTWNGGIISDIVRWRSFLTIRRKADGTWERIGGEAVNFINLTPAADTEVPGFTAQDAQAILGQ